MRRAGATKARAVLIMVASRSAERSDALGPVVVARSVVMSPPRRTLRTVQRNGRRPRRAVKVDLSRTCGDDGSAPRRARRIPSRALRPRRRSSLNRGTFRAAAAVVVARGGGPRLPLYVHTSNRSEQLVQALVQVLQSGPPGDDPTTPEIVAIQGKGMERWLSLQLAQRLGVWANFSFPFPRGVLDKIIAGVLRDESATTAPDPETERWRIARLLPALAAQRGFEPIRRYLTDDDDGVRRVELAARIANTFDHYAIYRPDMVLRWEDAPAPDDDWQPQLWRAIEKDARARGDGASMHAARRHAALERALTSSREPIPGLPSRVSLFGVTTLPPAWLSVLRAASTRIDVHLFLVAPSQHYWAEIRSQRDVARELAQKDVIDAADEERLKELVGNPLLASLGRVAREMQAVLESLDYQDGTSVPVEPAPDEGPATMLQTLQSDVLNLRHRRPGNAAAPSLPFPGDDRSVVVHACHGPMREVEVLHDQLLALYEELPDLEARDVVVMTPDIAAYAPAIEAVFGGNSGGSGGGNPGAGEVARIPYKVADLSAAQTNDVVAAFFAVLDVAAGRFTASQVVDLLTLAPVRTKFRIEADELDPIKEWIKRTGIRWGVDEHHRAEVGQPGDRSNTWRFGLDRLLVGYALPGGDRTIWQDVLPWDDLEGDGAHLLGRFSAFCDELFAVRDALHGPRPIAAWCTALERVLARMLDDQSANTHQHQLVTDALIAWQQRAERAGFTDVVPLKIARAEILQTLTTQTPARRFLAQGVTFCEMVPMRTIPFRVVALMGLSADTFPRGRWPAGFDLTAERRRIGDRSPRDDDRQLFLEALLSARDRFLVTYVGQSIADNTTLPPSVVVDELLDALGESYDVPPQMKPPTMDGDAREDRHVAIRRRLIVRHPLQPFSPTYFRPDRDHRLAAFSPTHHAGAVSLTSERSAGAPFVRRRLPPPEGELTVNVDDLVRFFRHPVRVFLQKRVGLFLDDGEARLIDREPLVLDPLARSELGRFLIAPALDGDDLALGLVPLQKTGKVPAGAVGEKLVWDAQSQTEEILAAHRALVLGERLPPLSVDGVIDGVRITGAISSLWPTGHVETGSRAMGAAYEPAAWVRHLVLCWAAPDTHPKDSWIIGKGDEGAASVKHFRRCDEAATHLEALMALYKDGMRRPLPWFPAVAWEFMRALLANKGDEWRALASAQVTFDKSGGMPCTKEDPFIQQIYGDVDPFEDGARLSPDLPVIRDEIAQLARAILTPMFAHQTGFVRGAPLREG